MTASHPAREPSNLGHLHGCSRSRTHRCNMKNLALLKAFKRHISPSRRAWIERIQHPRLAHLPIRRLTPVSRRYGMERGQPVDRYYIEGFLDQHRQCIRGVCLEIRDNCYTLRFGGDAVTRSDVLDINTSNTNANICGDLRKLPHVTSDTYDCIILTQVLQYIDQSPRAVCEAYRILKPRGTLLLTVPAISALDERDPSDLWRFTPNSARHLLEQHFPPASVVVQPYGNLLTSVAMLMGLAQEDLRKVHLDYFDAAYSCVIAARATKPDVPAAPAPARDGS